MTPPHDSSPDAPSIRSLDIPHIETADIELPDQVSGLHQLAYNLWWSWQAPARRLFAAIDPAAWTRYRNPVELLINVAPPEWEPLLGNEEFLATYEEVTQALHQYMNPTETWFSANHAGAPGPVAYFSMEYGIHQCLAIYSGGL
ncbi:MAG: DUF3417 domain-containing protein, partial [Thermoanaerobaculia bacterium]|nr:DUF3417 domain-containing protein [Thermoanaerobaculia bacterium]